jgi:chlorite dismutase
MSKEPATESVVPETREGWYVLHDCYTVNWPAWQDAGAEARNDAIEALRDWLAHARVGERGDSAAYTVTGQKCELMFIHYRSSPASLTKVRRDLQRSPLARFLQPVYGYLSVIEVSLYEATAMAHGALARQGLTPGSEGFDEAFAAELEKQTSHLETRLYRSIPEKRYCCFYPMSKRRGEHDNWYTMPLDERRALMRSHGKLGRKYHNDVTQVIAGSTGLDDWEWSVDLHADDPLVFKKLVYEMRFDAASARFAEFGPFYIGRLASSEQLATFLE